MRTINVLIIDDDPNIRKLLGELLAGRPEYRVLVAGDGKEAVRCFVEEKIDVVLTDIHMPGFTGLELMADMQKMKMQPEILVMTANATPENVETARKVGARSVILKPFDNLDVVEAEIAKAAKAALETGGGNGHGQGSAAPHAATAKPAPPAPAAARPGPPRAAPPVVAAPKPAIPIAIDTPPPARARAAAPARPASPPAAAARPAVATRPAPSAPPVAPAHLNAPAPEPDAPEATPDFDAWRGALVGNETPDTPQAPAGRKAPDAAKPAPTPPIAKPGPTARQAPPRAAAPRPPAAAAPRPPAAAARPAAVEEEMPEIEAPKIDLSPPAPAGDPAEAQDAPGAEHLPEIPAELNEIFQMVASLEGSTMEMQVPIICLQTWEEKGAIAALRQQAASMSRDFFTWSAARGVQKSDGQPLGEMYRDPSRALEFVRRQKNNGLYVLADFRQCLEDRMVVRVLREMVMEGETRRALLVLTAPRLPVPPELQPSCASFDWPAGGEDVDAVYQEVLAEVAASSGRAIKQDRAARAALLEKVREMPAGRARFEIARALMVLAKRAS